MSYKAHAFLVGFLDKSSGTFVGCSIFSEETPTTKASLHAFTLAYGYGLDYHEAKINLRAALQNTYWDWIRPHLKER